MILHRTQLDLIGILIVEGRVEREDVALLDTEMGLLVEQGVQFLALAIGDITYFSKLAVESIRRRRWKLEQSDGDLFLVGDSVPVFEQLRNCGVWTTFQTRIYADFERLAAARLAPRGLDVEQPSDNRFLWVASTFETNEISSFI